MNFGYHYFNCRCALTILVVLIALYPGCLFATMETEPNETLETANIALDMRTDGESSGDDIDWFRLNNLTQDSKVRITQTLTDCSVNETIGPQIYTWVWLKRSDNNYLWKLPNQDANNNMICGTWSEDVLMGPVTTAAWYNRIASGFYKQNADGDYSIVYQVSPYHPNPNEVEPNDRMSLASHVSGRVLKGSIGVVSQHLIENYDPNTDLTEYILWDQNDYYAVTASSEIVRISWNQADFFAKPGSPSNFDPVSVTLKDSSGAVVKTSTFCSSIQNNCSGEFTAEGLTINENYFVLIEAPVYRNYFVAYNVTVKFGAGSDFPYSQFLPAILKGAE